MRISAGTVLYRQSPEGITVLLVHPSGNYNRRAPWSIPKGEPRESESLESAARRETLEETGIEAGNLVPLGETFLPKSRKQIHAFCGPAPAAAIPCCASWEVDRAEFLPLPEAFGSIHPDQRILLERLAARLASAPEQISENPP